MIIKQGLTYLTALFLGIGTLYSGAQEISGLEIMQLVEDAQRRTNDSSFNRMQLSSCKFGVTDGRITCAERPRVKSLESVSKNYGAELKDTKSVTITLEPAAERGIGMLSYAYDEAGRDNETWLLDLRGGPAGPAAPALSRCLPRLCASPFAALQVPLSARTHA